MSSSSGSDEKLDFAPVVLIQGPEATLREAALAELRERVLAGAMRDFNEDRFDLSTAGVDPLAVIAAARTLPVMARARLVRVRGVGERRAEKFLDGALLEYLEAPVATTCLVLEGESVDKRQKWVKRVAKVGQVIECAGPSRPADVRRWIEARIASAACAPRTGSPRRCSTWSVADLDRLALEVEKLALYLGERGELSVDDVGRAGRPAPTARGVRAVRRDRRAPARQRAADGRASSPSKGSRHSRCWARWPTTSAGCCAPASCGRSTPAEVQRKLGVHPFAAQKLVEQARRFDLRRLRVCLDAVRRTDDALKGGVPIGPRLVLERLVLAVCA